MPVHDFHQSFNAGELDPLLDCRVAIEKYQAGLKQCVNFVPASSGPLIKRAGTVYIADQHAATGYASRLVGFNFGADEYGVFEIAANSLKIWSSSTAYAGAYSLGLYWQPAQLDGIKFCQINNIIYAAHPDNPVARITRSSASSYSVSFDFNWTYPPLLDENITTTTLAASATTGSGVTLTASAALFTADNVGSYFEIAHPRGSTFADVIMGDDQAYASKALTISALPADGDTVTLDGRAYTARTGGRDAADEIDAGVDADEFADNLLTAINTGGGGALQHETVMAEEIGGVKAVAYFGNTTGTNVSDNETVLIGKVTYKFQQSSDGINDPYEVKIGSNLQGSLQNLMRCINLSPYADPDASEPEYFWRNNSTGEETVEHPDVEAVEVTAVSGGYYLKVRARKQGAKANTIATTETATASGWYSDAALSSVATTLTGGTRVINIKARDAGTAGNSIAISESSSAMAFAGGATALSGGTDDSTTTSSSIQIVGKWEIRTTGRWKGTLYLEKERTIGGGTWDVVHSWKSEFDHNINFPGEDLTRTSYRLRFVGVGDDIDKVFPRAILEPADSYVRGLVKVTGYTSSTVVTVTVINDLSSTSATPVWSEGAWSPRRGFPRACCFHQNRLWFAGTEYEPFKLWASQLGDFENFRYSSSDDGAMSFQIASTDLQEILWLVSHNGLFIGTTSGEWVAAEADGQNVITPTNPPIFRQVSAYGSKDVQAQIVGESVVFINRHGRQVRRIGRDQGGGYSTGNLTALAAHICQSGVKSLAVQKLPETVVWAMRVEGGDFVCLTTEPEQNVFAWAQHTGAECWFESIAVVSGPDGDELWFSADVNGTRVILRTDPTTLNRNPSEYAADEAVHVDCAVLKSGAAFTTVTIPSCLVGCEVVVKYADGSTQTKSPSGTTLTVNSTTSVIVGIAIDSTAQTMRLEYAMKDGTAQGRAIKPTRATVRVKSSQGGRVRCGEGAWESLKYPRDDSSYTGGVLANIASSFKNDGTVTLNHSEPWPMVVTGMILRVDVGDDPAHQFIEQDSIA